MCIIPYATQEGEISFCAYNTGVGWRQIVESLFQNATTAEWFKTKGRHEIFAAGKEVALSAKERLDIQLPDMIELPVLAAAGAGKSEGGCASGGCGSH